MKTRFLAAALMLASVSTFVPAPLPAQTQASTRYIPLQGQLTSQSGAPVTDGTYSVLVTVYQTPDQPASLWDDTYNDLPVIKGVFNLLLGSQKPLSQVNSGSQDLIALLNQYGILYVGLTVTKYNGAAVSNSVEMKPRLLLLPVPFAQDAGSAKLFGGHAATDYFNGLKARKAEDADTLGGDSWSALLSAGSKPSDEGAKIKNSMLPDGTNPSATLRPGAVIESLGGIIETAVDLRSLDSNNDGIPDLPLASAKNVKGAPATEFDWAVCVQNGLGTLRFPNPSPTDPGGYGTIFPEIQGVSVPDKPLTVGAVANPKYEWHQIAPDTGVTPLTNVTLTFRPMAYDSLLDGYWLMGDSGDTNFYFIYRKSTDDSKYLIATVATPGGTPVADEGVTTLAVVDASGSHYLVRGMNTVASPTQAAYRLKINGTTPASVTLSDYQAYLSSGGSESRRSWAAPLFDPNTKEVHFLGGVGPSGATANYDDVAYLNPANSDRLTWTRTPTYTLGDTVSAAATFDSTAHKGYVFGGYALPTTTLNKVRIYDRTADTWSQVTSFTGTPPTGRFGSAACVSPVNSDLVVFGGDTTVSASGGGSNELWTYHPATTTWTLATQTAAPSQSPPGVRVYPSYCFDTKRNVMMIWGGNDGNSTKYNTLWELALGGKAATFGTIIRIK